MKLNPVYQCVEKFDDGTELVRMTSCYKMCAMLYVALVENGFKASIRLVRGGDQ